MRAYLGLGSNLGDREAHLREAVASREEVVAVSGAYETEPLGGPGGQDPYLNAVVALETERSPRALLAECQRLEAAAGRVRAERWGPRSLDVDLLAVGDRVVDEPACTIPHPRIAERAFVLVPWADVDPDFTVPGLGRVADLRDKVGSAGVTLVDDFSLHLSG